MKPWISWSLDFEVEEREAEEDKDRGGGWQACGIKPGGIGRMSEHFPTEVKTLITPPSRCAVNSVYCLLN